MQVSGMLVLGLLALVGGCASSGSGAGNRAPVEDRGTMSSPSRVPAGVVNATPAPAASVSAGAIGTPLPPIKLPPGHENAGKPGYYTVKPGDTLIRIGLDTGQNWRDVGRWNSLDNPNIIEVGQVLRVIPPGTVETAAAVARPAPSPTPIVASSLPSQGTRSASAPIASASVSITVPATTATARAPLPPASSPSDEDMTWIWPTAGSLIAGFDEVKNKGIDIAGKLGEPILAAGDGRVVYAGADLRGYGNLVILKHNNTFLTAYAHNQTLLVKEDQTVRKGQKIAEMGQSDTDRVKLHFEIRRQGKPVDPARYLPAR